MQMPYRSRAGLTVEAKGSYKKTVTAKPSPFLFLFLTGLIVPVFIFVGDLRLSVYRLVLLVAVVPAMLTWITGAAGRKRLADLVVLALCIWTSVSISVNHGFSASIEAIGIFWVETCGAYFLGRSYIRTRQHFLAVVKILFSISVIALPFAMYEAFFGTNWILEVFSKVGTTYFDTNMDPRLGLQRVQGPFPHPIHFGVFFFSIFGVVHYVLGHEMRFLSRSLVSLLVSFVGFLSLSSGPLVAWVTQFYMIFWDFLMRSFRYRWFMFSGLAFIAFVVVDLLSNRTPFHVLIEYLAFNRETAYNRLQIWEFGTKNIYDNPLFGLGFRDWSRPTWMSESIDMFWIVGGMRHGVLVWALWFLLFFSVLFGVLRRRFTSAVLQSYRTGYVVTMIGFFMAGWTVHYWDITYVYFVFFLGSGLWFFDAKCGETDFVPSIDSNFGHQYSRFSSKDLRSVRVLRGS